MAVKLDEKLVDWTDFESADRKARPMVEWTVDLLVEILFFFVGEAVGCIVG